MDDWTRAAFERLLKLAQSDTGQSRRAANFLLAWWNGEILGGFDLTDLFNVDSTIAADMATVFTWIAAQDGVSYPAEYRAEIEKLIEKWRPHVWAKAKAAS